MRFSTRGKLWGESGKGLPGVSLSLLDSLQTLCRSARAEAPVPKRPCRSACACSGAKFYVITVRPVKFWSKIKINVWYFFRRYLTRKIGFEAVMRVRCTKGNIRHQSNFNPFNKVFSSFFFHFILSTWSKSLCFHPAREFQKEGG